MSEPSSKLPPRPSLEQLRKRAKDLLRAARSSDADAITRLRAASSRVDPERIVLADAQHVVAREHGFSGWGQLVRHIDGLTEPGGAFAKPMIRPVELRGSRPYTLADGTQVTTEDVWRTFVAARAGDLAEVKSFVAKAPALALVEYNYTPPIHFAVREGHVALVEFLLDRGADLAYRSYPFSDSLLMMAEDREHDDVATLLRQRLSRHFALSSGTKVIIDDAGAGDAGRVQAELSRDPNLARVSNETGDTALHHAAHNGHLDLVHTLLAAGANPDAIRGDGYRPIHLALMPNWLMGVPRERGEAIAGELLARGARYTMFIAALRGDREFIRDALRRDRSLANEEDTNHHRPISAAARRNDVALALLLLDHGADPNLPEEGAPRGHALWIAVHNRYRELARLLVERGADPDGMVESSGTPMMRAEKDPELSALLKAHGGKAHRGPREELEHLIGEQRYADVERMVREQPALIHDEEASWGDGILAGPAHGGDHEMIALLMRLGARVPPVSKWAPYYYFKHEATAEFLLQQGMDPNHMNWHRLTLLHHMAAEGELRKAQLLIAHGADIDAVDEEYRSTPLGLAARRGQRELVSLLLERGADPDLAGTPWARPLAWARKKGQQEVADVLIATGAS